MLILQIIAPDPRKKKKLTKKIFGSREKGSPLGKIFFWIPLVVSLCGNLEIGPFFGSGKRKRWLFGKLLHTIGSLCSSKYNTENTTRVTDIKVEKDWLPGEVSERPCSQKATLATYALINSSRRQSTHSITSRYPSKHWVFFWFGPFVVFLSLSFCTLSVYSYSDIWVTYQFVVIGHD